jgi:hypothetical protein
VGLSRVERFWQPVGHVAICQKLEAIVREGGPRTVTQQTLEASAVGSGDRRFAIEEKAIAMSGEFARRWRGSREIVEDAGFARNRVGQDELGEVACVIAILVGGWSDESAVVGTTIDVRGCAARDIANDGVDIVVGRRRLPSIETESEKTTVFLRIR